MSCVVFYLLSPGHTCLLNIVKTLCDNGLSKAMESYANHMAKQLRQ